ncbi:hypothetical protein GCM10009802_51770 [Streptomyces synnematoformans]|uniref:Secreted protein n=2 Tax=Streptomyces synnematoformans TaxID=415721 RepID=A0ABN2ZF47_9ACTN
MSRYAKALGSFATVAVMAIGGLAVAPAAQAAPAAQTQAASAASGWEYWGYYYDFDTCMESGAAYARAFGADGYRCTSEIHPGYWTYNLYLLF